MFRQIQVRLDFLGMRLLYVFETIYYSSHHPLDIGVDHRPIQQWPTRSATKVAPSRRAYYGPLSPLTKEMCP